MIGRAIGVSLKYLAIIRRATLPPVGRRSLRTAILHPGLPRGRGGLFQNRETKETLPGDQLQVMGEAGGGLPGNSHARPNMGMTDVTAPPALAVPFLRSLSQSLFVSSF
jgi:hypothetical protein